MSEYSAIPVPLGISQIDIVVEISDLARDHGQQSYFNALSALADERQAAALADAALQIPVLIREFAICHDLALSQVVRAGRGSNALQSLLLSGGLETILKFDASGQLNHAQYFARFLVGTLVTTKGSSGNPDHRIIGLRNRLTSLAGSERAGVGLGALAAFFSVAHFIISGYARLPSRAVGTPRAPVDALVTYRDLLDTAMRDIASSVSGRRAIAFGATQACTLTDDLFAILTSRIAICPR
jgi:hypothetical protein